MKNSPLKSKMLPILLMLIKKWRYAPLLYDQYDLREFIYQTVKSTQDY
jgi:hypothetical protein